VGYFYNDKQIEQGYIAPLVEGDVEVHGELRFTYRPMTVLDHAKWEQRDDDGDKWYRKRAAMLAERVKTWSLSDPIGAAVMLRLMPRLFMRLESIVWGRSASDLDPQWSAEKHAAETELITEAAAVGATPGAVREAADEKNSVAG